MTTNKDETPGTWAHYMVDTQYIPLIRVGNVLINLEEIRYFDAKTSRLMWKDGNITVIPVESTKELIEHPTFATPDKEERAKGKA